MDPSQGQKTNVDSSCSQCTSRYRIHDVQGPRISLIHCIDADDDATFREEHDFGGCEHVDSRLAFLKLEAGRCCFFSGLCYYFDGLMGAPAINDSGGRWF
jgi:hypothetical protein